MPNLDGTEKITPTPFDAHEQTVRNSDGYQYQEYPKAVDHVPHPDPVAAAAGQKEPVVVNSADEEAAATKENS